MKIKVLGSNSKGNCYIINNEFILDVGVNLKDIIKKIDNFILLKGVLITHEHL